MRDVLLGIDAGTSSVKAGAFTPDGVLAASCSLPVSLNCLSGGGVEVDPGQYLETVLRLIRRITDENSVNVLSVGFSTACPTSVCMDAGLDAVRPAIPFLDNRAAASASLLPQSLPEQNVTNVGTAGSYSASVCSVTDLMWVRDNEPENWRRTEKAGMLNSYLAGQFTGSAAVDITQASYSGVFDLVKPDDWDRNRLALAGIPMEKMLPVARPYDRIGRVLKRISLKTGLPEGCPVALGAADTAAAAFAIGFRDSRSAFESAGTSGVLSFVLDEPVFDPVFMNRCHIYPGLWLAHGAISSMGGALQWLKKNIWTDFPTFAEMDKVLSQSAPGANGVVFLPYLAGERSPVWDPDASAVWFGMNLKTSRADLIESVYESGAFALKQLKDHAESLWGRKIESVAAVGNGTHGSEWNQIKADILQVDYNPVASADAAVYGAALLGGIAAGIFSGPDDDSIVPVLPDHRVFHPCDGNVLEKYMKSYKIYRSLYPATKKLMHNEISENCFE